MADDKAPAALATFGAIAGSLGAFAFLTALAAGALGAGAKTNPTRAPSPKIRWRKIGPERWESWLGSGRVGLVHLAYLDPSESWVAGYDAGKYHRFTVHGSSREEAVAKLVEKLPGAAKREAMGAQKNPIDLTVANTILQQMGGSGRLRAMIGAKDFIGSQDVLVFKFTAKSRIRANAVRITLEPSDTYKVEFLFLSGTKPPRVVKVFDDVYNDQLKDVFEQTTGLYLSL